VNRTDRLYALVEELRAVSPRPRSASWLADRFEVNRRTILRDLDTLGQAGVPIWAMPGRGGGYVLDRERTLPPLNITAQEAIAVGVALEQLAGTPFQMAARSALTKLLSVMPRESYEAARALAERVHLGASWLISDDRVPGVLQDALARGEVLRIRYVDRNGAATDRFVEPLGLLATAHGWYLFAWCRTREDVRAFRLDRVESAESTGETAPPRPLDLPGLGLPARDLFRLDLRVDLFGKR
jgi:predicted DNA-binding transcriptional regulator YafY